MSRQAGTPRTQLLLRPPLHCPGRRCPVGEQRGCLPCSGAAEGAPVGCTFCPPPPARANSPSLAFFFLARVPPILPRNDSSFFILWGRSVGERMGAEDMGFDLGKGVPRQPARAPPCPVRECGASREAEQSSARGEEGESSRLAAVGSRGRASLGGAEDRGRGGSRCRRTQRSSTAAKAAGGGGGTTWPCDAGDARSGGLYRAPGEPRG